MSDDNVINLPSRGKSLTLDQARRAGFLTIDDLYVVDDGAGLLPDTPETDKVWNIAVGRALKIIENMRWNTPRCRYVDEAIEDVRRLLIEKKPGAA